jgi:RimJ/RimL family protein N-acetyltransferase
VSLDRQPVLGGERLLLRPLTEDDREALYFVASDPLVWEQHPIHDRWQREVFDAFFDEAMASGGALAAIDRQTEAVAGSSRFVFQPLLEETPLEIGWTFLARALWGTGANREMKRLMLAHAFDSVERVVLRIGADNRRSRIACERIGGVLTDEVERGEYRGNPLVHVVYEITREAFKRGPLSS